MTTLPVHGGVFELLTAMLSRPMERAVPEGMDVAAAARKAAAILSRDERMALVYLFGSAADRSRPSPGDMDLAVLTRPPLTLDELTRVRGDLVEAIGVPLDLISLDDAPIVLAHEEERLRGLGGFRNLLVHGYSRLDPGRVLAYLRDAPAHFSAFSRDVRRWLETVPRPG